MLQPCSWDQAVLFLLSFLLVSQTMLHIWRGDCPQALGPSRSVSSWLSSSQLWPGNASWDADKDTLLIQIPASVSMAVRGVITYIICILFTYILFLHIRKRGCLGTQDLPEFPGKAATCNGSVKSCPLLHWVRTCLALTRQTEPETPRQQSGRGCA